MRRAPRRGSTVLPSPPLAGGGSARNVLLVSHGDFSTNSGLHVRAIASELARRGYDAIAAVPGRPAGGERFPIVSHADAVRGGLRFKDGRGVDLVHAFTPRPAVIGVTAATGSPYVVQLEDDDARIVGGTSAELRDAFVARAVGVTAVVDRLLELKPEAIPGVVAWPGFDEAELTPRRERRAVRDQLGVADDTTVLLYHGNVQETNLDDMRELYRAVLSLREHGIDAVLVKCGWSFVPRSRLPRLDEGLRDLGWVDREHIPDLLHAADVFVQPGSPGTRDDFRFPSKLPEFLASGRPVVLPRTNIGLHLRHGEDALLLESGDADEIVDCVTELAADGTLRERIGSGGRAFAHRLLQWPMSVDHIVELYEQL
jgi:glycosyltransferase involved in cell wall biosynthesis